MNSQSAPTGNPAATSAGKPVAGRHGKGHWLRVSLGMAIGGVLLALLFRRIDFVKVGSLLDRATLAPLLFALATYVTGFLLRSIRFWAMLGASAGRRLPLGQCVAPFIASFGISDVLPFRAGDGFRILWFHRRFGIAAGTLIGTMLVERILDLAALMAIAAAGLMLAGVSAPPAMLAGLEVLVAVIIGGVLAILFAPAFLARLSERWAPRFMRGPASALTGALDASAAAVRHVGSWRRLMFFAILSLGCWIFESMVFLGAWWSLGGPPGVLAKPFLASAFSTIGTLVPSLPGHFGSFEYFGVQAFALVGIEPSFAAATVFLAHLVLWAPTAIFGMAWLLFTAMRRPPHHSQNK